MWYHIKHAKLDISRGTVTAVKILPKRDDDRKPGKKKLQTPSKLQMKTLNKTEQSVFLPHF